MQHPLHGFCKNGRFNAKNGNMLGMFEPQLRKSLVVVWFSKLWFCFSYVQHCGNICCQSMAIKAMWKATKRNEKHWMVQCRKGCIGCNAMGKQCNARRLHQCQRAAAAFFLLQFAVNLVRQKHLGFFLAFVGNDRHQDVCSGHKP